MTFFGWGYVKGSSAWGDITGTTERMCEMDCYITPWIVEFINTLTNLLYIYLGLRGYRYSCQQSKDSSILLAHAFHILVGFGSTAYHLNIKYLSQMADEISMLLLTNTLLYCAFSIPLHKIPNDHSSNINKYLKISIILLTGLLSSVHYAIGSKKLFESCFITLVGILASRSVRLLNSRIRNHAVRQQAKDLLTFTSGLFIFAIGIQKLDFSFCAELTHLRSKLGMPLGFLTELHGWWHILTAFAVYDFITFIEFLRVYTESDSHKTKNRKDRAGSIAGGGFDLIWGGLWRLPRVQEQVSLVR